MNEVSATPAALTESRAEIVTAAATCFMRRGYDKTTIDDIADALGATKGRVYHDFRSKSAIFFAVYREAMRYCLEAVEPIVAMPLPARERLQRRPSGWCRHIWPAARARAAAAHVPGACHGDDDHAELPARHQAGPGDLHARPHHRGGARELCRTAAPPSLACTRREQAHLSPEYGPAVEADVLVEHLPAGRRQRAATLEALHRRAPLPRTSRAG